MSDDQKKPRRLMRALIDHHELIEYLNLHKNIRETKDHFVIVVPVLDGVPEGTVVVHVHEDFRYLELSVILEHESFPEVNPGELIPILPGMEPLTITRKCYLINKSEAAM